MTKRLALIVVAAALIGGLVGAAVEVALGRPPRTSPATSVSTTIGHADPAGERVGTRG